MAISSSGCIVMGRPLCRSKSAPAILRNETVQDSIPGKLLHCIDLVRNVGLGASGRDSEGSESGGGSAARLASFIELKPNKRELKYVATSLSESVKHRLNELFARNRGLSFNLKGQKISVEQLYKLINLSLERVEEVVIQIMDERSQQLDRQFNEKLLQYPVELADIEGVRQSHQKKRDALLNKFADYALLAVTLSDPDNFEEVNHKFRLIEGLFLYDDKAEAEVEDGFEKLSKISKNTRYFIRKGKYKNAEESNVGGYFKADSLFREVYNTMKQENKSGFILQFLDYVNSLKSEYLLIKAVTLIEQKYSLLNALQIMTADIAETKRVSFERDLYQLKPYTTAATYDEYLKKFMEINKDIEGKIAEVKERILNAFEGTDKLKFQKLLTEELVPKVKEKKDSEILDNMASIFERRTGLSAAGLVFASFASDTRFLWGLIPYHIGLLLGIDNDLKSFPKEVLKKEMGLNTVRMIRLVTVNRTYKETVYKLVSDIFNTLTCNCDDRLYTEVFVQEDLTLQENRAITEIFRFILANQVWQEACFRYDRNLVQKELEEDMKKHGVSEQSIPNLSQEFLDKLQDANLTNIEIVLGQMSYCFGINVVPDSPNIRSVLEPLGFIDSLHK
jgi:hypothetical protein